MVLAAGGRANDADQQSDQPAACGAAEQVEERRSDARDSSRTERRELHRDVGCSRRVRGENADAESHENSGGNQHAGRDSEYR